MKRRKQEYETPDYAAMLRRMVRAYGRRVADADVEDLADMASIQAELDKAIQTAVDGLREREVSWTQIGQAFGITKQSAFNRYGRNVVLPLSRTHE